MGNWPGGSSTFGPRKSKRGATTGPPCACSTYIFFIISEENTSDIIQCFTCHNTSYPGFKWWCGQCPTKILELFLSTFLATLQLPLTSLMGTTKVPIHSLSSTHFLLPAKRCGKQESSLPPFTRERGQKLVPTYSAKYNSSITIHKSQNLNSVTN